jgi:hypothetical protein
MTMSPRIRHLTVLAATALALSLSGFAAVPAHAQGQSSCAWYNNVIPNGGIWETTTPGVQAFSFYEGVTFPYTGYVTCDFANGMSTELTMQGDGNFVFYASNGKKWGSNTRPNGRDAEFQSDGNLVVRDTYGTALWASNTHTYPHAVLSFQDDGNLVIYPSSSDFAALWATKTNS